MLRDPILWVFALIVVLVGGGLLYFQSAQQPPTAVPPVDEAQPVAEAQAEPEERPIRYPVPQRSAAPAVAPESEETAEQPAKEQPNTLPALDDSDALLQSQLARLFASQRLEERLNLDAIARRFVVTVDNLPGTKLPRKHIVMRPAPGRFAVVEEGELLYLAPENFSRYTPLVQLLENADNELLVSVYIDLYPLFQQAYEELGYPSRYFNDRLIDVIDHLLATPDIDHPIRLVRSRALYLYADPRLEDLSSGQKILLRLGPDNASRVKMKLQEFRAALQRISQAAGE